jgi:type IV secretory pathway TraG/TraD family ATPase VirD4
MSQYRLGEGPYGSAYRGTINDLFGAGDLTPIEAGKRSFGLFLGHFDWVQSLQYTWHEPAKGILAWFKQKKVNRQHIEYIPQVRDLRFTGDQHHLIVASSGAGKFRDVLSNMLLYDGSCETACLIIDPKGEIASTTGTMIDAPGATDPRTVILDPWDLCGTGVTDALTLLDGINPDNPHCVKDARVLADAIIIERSSEDGHWVITAKNFLAALLLYLGLDPFEKEERTLFRLRQIVTMPWNDLCSLLGYMSDSKLFEGLVARAAQAMLNRDEKERRAILSTLERDTAFVEDPSLWKAIKSSSFDINQLVLTNKRLHVILPFDYTDQMSSWLRLTIAAFYNACLRNQLSPQLPSYLRFRHIIIDEFAGLGKLDFIMKGIAEARGAGIKYHIVIQNFPQLHALYKEGWENFVSNSFVHAFGVNDNFTAEYLSKMTGQSTVITESKSFSESTTTGTSYTSGSSNTSGSGGGSSGSSSSTTNSSSTTRGSSVTFSSVGRPVLMADEIRRISGSQQLLFLRQMPVLLSRRTPYFETFKNFRPRHALRDIISSTLLLGKQRALVPYSFSNVQRDSPLSAVNSVMRMPSFVPPSYKPYTLAEALRQSPRFVLASVAVVALMLWIIPSALISEAEQVAEAAQAAATNRAAAERAAAIAQQEAARASEAEAEAHAIDERIRAPYSTLAASVFDTVNRIGMCASNQEAAPGISCDNFATYAGGQLAPFNLSFNVQRKQFVTLSFSPENEKRGGALNGVAATLSVKSVYADIDLNSGDEARFHPVVHRALASLLQSFDVPARVLDQCGHDRESTPQSFNGTSVSCQFTARPVTIGGLAEFSITFERQM